MQHIECACYDPVVFGHQSKWCRKSLRFGLDDLDTYVRACRDDEQRNEWHDQAHDEMIEAEKRVNPDPFLWRVLCRLLRVRRKAL